MIFAQLSYKFKLIEKYNRNHRYENQKALLKADFLPKIIRRSSELYMHCIDFEWQRNVRGMYIKTSF